VTVAPATSQPPTVPEFRYQPSGNRLAPFDLRPRYRDVAGREAPVPGTGRVDLAALATWFTVPALTRDLFPVSPWPAVRRWRATPPRPDGRTDPAELRDRLDDAVERVLGDREQVAVATSGGLDSAALLAVAARLCRRSGRRLTAMTMDIPDDRGRRPRAVVDRLLEFLGTPARHLVVGPAVTAWPEPDWCPHGPRFDGFPRLHRGMAELARGAGAEILLHGSGADQVLETPAYLAGGLLRSGRLADARAYWRDAGGGEEVPVRELAAPVAGGLHRSTSAGLYWATAWPRLLADPGSPLLADAPGEAGARWAGTFREEAARVASRTRASWAEALVMHRTFPLDVVVPATDLPEAAPYLDPAFALYAYHLPLAARYSAGQPSAYLRRKHLVAALLPEGVDSVVPPYRQRAYAAYERYWRTALVEPALSRELGLLRPDWRRRCRDAFDLATVGAVETWLRQATERGAVPG
jgi:asparagine synthetase B (glutamine-hydrolysing)